MCGKVSLLRAKPFRCAERLGLSEMPVKMRCGCAASWGHSPDPGLADLRKGKPFRTSGGTAVVRVAQLV